MRGDDAEFTLLFSARKHSIWLLASPRIFAEDALEKAASSSSLVTRARSVSPSSCS